MAESRKGKIQTVTGLINPESLGVTMTHEHLWIDSSDFFIPPPDKSKASQPFTLPNYGWILQNPYSHRPNLGYGPDDKQTIIDEMKFFKQNGGCSIVDNTTVGLEPNLPFLKHLSETTGVNIIAGTGYYVDQFQSESIRALSVEAMCEHMRHEIVDGHANTGIKCGVIGEVGCAWPLTDFEKRSIQASAIVQSELGTPVIIHPGRDPQAPFDIVRIYQEAGGDVNRVVMSHLDRTIFEVERLLEFAGQGAYCEYDLFGIEQSHYQPKPQLDMISDAQRVKMVRTLIENGYGDKICVSQDIHTKHRLTQYGGHGFSHVLVNIVPKMLSRGISQEDVDKILIHNPKKWLTYQK